MARRTTSSGWLHNMQAPPTNPASAHRSAARDIAPFAVALIPFGLAIGNASAGAGLSTFETVVGAALLLAGASQLAAVEVIGAGGGTALMVLVVTLINLRFAIYGAGVARWFSDLPFRNRMLLAYPIVDQTFMICQERFEIETDVQWRQQYYLTATALLAGTFITGQLVGFTVGTSLPVGLGLHIAAPLAFAGMLAKSVTTTSTLRAASVAGATMVLGAGVFGAAALPLGVVLGVAVSARQPATRPAADLAGVRS